MSSSGSSSGNSTVAAGDHERCLDGDELLLRAAEDAVARARRAGADRLLVAYQWACAHRIDGHCAAEPAEGLEGHGRIGRSGFADVRTIGAVAIAVTEYCPAELAVALRLHPLAAND